MDAPLLSATQISLWRECQRKWGFRYLEGIKPAQTKGAALGQEVQDEQIDPWLAEGRQFDFSKPSGSGEIALEVAKLLPPPKTPGLQLRRGFLMPSPTGRWGYRGELDLYADDSRIVPGLGNPITDEAVRLVGDLKVPRDLRWAKSAEDLKTDVQAEIYAMHVLFSENVDAVDLVWFSVRSRKPHRAQRAHLRVYAPHVVEQFEKIEATGGDVVTALLARPKAQDLPPNVRACEAYGGCPYRHICNLSPSNFAAGWEVPSMNSSTNDFLASLRKAAPAAPAAVPAAFAPGGAFAGLPAPSGHVAPGGNPHPAVVVNANVHAPEPALPPWATAPVDPLKEQRQAIHAAHAAPAINPPESALPPASPVGAAAPAPASPSAPATPRGPGRPKKTETPAAPVQAPASSGVHFDPEMLSALSALMRAHGVKRVAFDGTDISEIELA